MLLNRKVSLMQVEKINILLACFEKQLSLKGNTFALKEIGKENETLLQKEIHPHNFPKNICLRSTNFLVFLNQNAQGDFCLQKFFHLNEQGQEDTGVYLKQDLQAKKQSLSIEWHKEELIYGLAISPTSLTLKKQNYETQNLLFERHYDTMQTTLGWQGANMRDILLEGYQRTPKLMQYLEQNNAPYFELKQRLFPHQNEDFDKKPSLKIIR